MYHTAAVTDRTSLDELAKVLRLYGASMSVTLSVGGRVTIAITGVDPDGNVLRAVESADGLVIAINSALASYRTQVGRAVASAMLASDQSPNCDRLAI